MFHGSHPNTSGLVTALDRLGSRDGGTEVEGEAIYPRRIRRCVTEVWTVAAETAESGDGSSCVREEIRRGGETQPPDESGAGEASCVGEEREGDTAPGPESEQQEPQGDDEAESSSRHVPHSES
ncbi:uncharacterized protein LOC121880518 isoform X4 [Thunnus maccoyii]|uniref:uncharacterized protein LOC121880518 isoform X4 n=1 Tax=Thunnus maccoyii TaxID=8240 RepID=UPI001C4D95E0|nr:uncharacterized protein LOC121880518 isoform X4 [Thunnus maccoyii]